MKKLLALALFFVATLPAFSQGLVPVVGNPIDRGPSLPTTCFVGQGLYFKTSAADGLGIVGVYACLATNTWVNISGGGPTAGADVLVVHTDNSTTPFFKGNYAGGTTALKAGAALAAACTGLLDKDTVQVGNETYDFGTASAVTCDLSNGATITANLKGSGPQSVIERGFSGTAPIVGPGLTHSRVQDVYIQSYITPGPSNFEIPVENRLANGTYYDVTDFGLERVKITGVSDCYIINPSTTVTAYVRDSTCDTNWDSWTDTGNGGALTLTLINTATTCTPDSSNHICTCYKASESTGSSVYNFQGGNTCTITSSDAAATIRALDAEGSGVGAIVFNAGPGLKIDTTGVSVGTVFDINMGTTGTVFNVQPGVIYNSSRMRTDRGTLNQVGLLTNPLVLTGGIIGGSNQGGGAWSNTALDPFGDAATSAFSVMPTAGYIYNFTFTTSNTNGTPPVIAQLDTNFASSPTRLHGYLPEVPPQAVAGAYVDTKNAPYFLPNGFPWTVIGALTIPTGSTAATVKGWSASLVGTNQGILGAYVNGTIAASTTKFIGPSNTLQTSGNETLTQSVMPSAYSISELCVYTSTTQGAAGSLVVTLRKGAADQALTVTVPTSGTAGPYCNTGTAITGSAGDLIDFKLVNNDAANPTGTIVEVTANDVPTAPATGKIIFGLGSSTLTSNQNNYAPPFSGVATSTTQLNNQIGMPRAFFAKNLYCRVNTCPGTNPATVTVQQNGSSKALTINIPVSCGAPTTISDTTDIVSFAAGDLLNIIENQVTSGTAAGIASCSIETD